MAIYADPIIKKFFTNKIESSKDEWGDYLLEVADIFSMFDGEILDRSVIEERFSTISGRSPYALRDVANFRDEFGAYGTFLGLYHVEKNNNNWVIYLSKAAKHFLCSVEPDVESFCRTQLALFQYPNGAGALQNSSNGSVRMQQNSKKDTLREIANGIRINPLRLLCQIVVAQHEIQKIPLDRIDIGYELVFMLFNDDRINHSFTPSIDSINTILTEYNTVSRPAWTKGRPLRNFKRNFHIFERVGIFKRAKGSGLVLDSDDYNRAYNYAKMIGLMTHNFDGFEECYTSNNPESDIESVVFSPKWGRYFDSLTLPMNILLSLSSNVSDEDIIINDIPIGNTTIDLKSPFLDIKKFETNQVRAFISSGINSDPFETLVLREKANREHARILNMIAANLRAKNFDPYDNTFIDLCATINGRDYIFEVKSNTAKNALSQIRKAVSQLYEYRYRSGKSQAILCIVMQTKPLQDWVIDYLIRDREMLLCWLVDNIRLECPDACLPQLSCIGIDK